MYFLGDVDCTTCANLDTGYCDDCIHNERLEDHYVRAGKDTLKKREEAERKRLEDELTDGKIRVELPEEFLKVFAAAKKFTAHDWHKEFILVHAEKNRLSACDGRILAFLNCEVPQELTGKNIVRIEEGNMVLTHSGTVPWQDKPENAFVEANKVVALQDLPEWAVKFVDDPFEDYKHVLLDLPEAKIAIKQKYYQLVKETLTGNVKLYYRDGTSAVLFVGDNGRIVVLPLRTEDS
jgi:hypothetical protein